MSSGSAAVGSVWNASSWHWEERNFTKFAKDRVAQLLQELVVVGGGERKAKCLLEDIRVDGECSVSVRKGKQIIAFELGVKARWRAEVSSGGEGGGGAAAATTDGEEAAGGVEGDQATTPQQQRIEGSLHVEPFSPDDLQDDDIVARVTLAKNDLSSSSGAQKNMVMSEGEAKRFVESDVLAEVKKALRRFVEDLRSLLSNEATLREQHARRAEEQRQQDEAVQLKGEEKERLLEEQRSIDLQRREEAQRTAASSSQDAKQRKGEGSVWNPNSYHWEEKPLTSWALAELRRRLEETKLFFLDGSATLQFIRVEVQGEAAISIRKGKKIVIFDMEISTDWTAVARDEKGGFLADAKGGCNVEEFSSEEIESLLPWDEEEEKKRSEDAESLKGVVFTFDSKLLPQERINNAIRKEGKRSMTMVLMAFVNALYERH